MVKEQLDEITEFLICNVWRNRNVMFDNSCIEEGDVSDLVDIISSLHNLLYEEVTGQRYNYAFHWANKVGSDVVDNIFDKEQSDLDIEKAIEEELEACRNCAYNDCGSCSCYEKKSICCPYADDEEEGD